MPATTSDHQTPLPVPGGKGAAQDQVRHQGRLRPPRVTAGKILGHCPRYRRQSHHQTRQRHGHHQPLVILGTLQSWETIRYYGRAGGKVRCGRDPHLLKNAGFLAVSNRRACPKTGEGREAYCGTELKNFHTVKPWKFQILLVFSVDHRERTMCVQ